MSLKQELVDWVFFDSKELEDRTNLIRAISFHLAGFKRDIASYSDECDVIKGKLIVLEHIIEDLKCTLDVYVYDLLKLFREVDKGVYDKLIEQTLKEN